MAPEFCVFPFGDCRKRRPERPISSLETSWKNVRNNNPAREMAEARQILAGEPVCDSRSSTHQAGIGTHYARQESHLSNLENAADQATFRARSSKAGAET